MAIWTYGIWHIVFVHAWEFCVKAWEFGDHRWLVKPTFYFNTVSHLNTARSFCATSKNWRHFFFLAQDLILFLSYFKSSILSLKCVKIVIEHNYLEIRVTWFLIGIYWPSIRLMSVSGLSDIFRCRLSSQNSGSQGEMFLQWVSLDRRTSSCTGNISTSYPL